MKKPTPIRVLIADDHPVVREGLKALIDRRPDMKVVAEAANGQETVEQVFTHHPDVTLMDLRMPQMDGVEAISAIRERDPAARIIILTTFDGEEDVYRGLRAGAKAYLLKDAPREELLECIHAVHAGKTWIPPDVAAKLATRVSASDLTPRELEVLQMIVAGKSNKEIGVILHISEGTVKVHVNHILQKMGVGGRTEASIEALKRGLVRLD